MPLDGTGWPVIETEAPTAPLRIGDLSHLDRVGRTLIRTRDRLERGWARGSLHRGRVAVCILGALDEITGFFPYELPGAQTIYQWNDAQDTRAEVIALLNEAISSPSRARFRLKREAIARECSRALACVILIYR